MRYVSGIHALNLPCSLNTCGDWHCSALRWVNVCFLESNESPFKDYGIESNKTIPEHDGVFYAANHIRACLNLIYMQKFYDAQGMRNDFICTDEYDQEIFEKVYLLKDETFWSKINDFMTKEYLKKWRTFILLKEK